VIVPGEAGIDAMAHQSPRRVGVDVAGGYPTSYPHPCPSLDTTGAGKDILDAGGHRHLGIGSKDPSTTAGIADAH